ncbi:MAG: hypothetical protein SFU25_07425 [Candidatus Caenarcaniphilales bacterium]|nr:hypothetical protein [Candidatus Caenarcaniphilales bacterium]
MKDDSESLKHILRMTISYLETKKISAEEIIEDSKKLSKDSSFSQGTLFCSTEILSSIKEEIHSEGLNVQDFF